MSSDTESPPPGRLTETVVMHFRRWKSWWLTVLVLLSLPYIVLITGGTIWLYQFEIPITESFSLSAVWPWLLISILSTAAGWLMARWLRGRMPPPPGARVAPSLNWSPRGEDAWRDVERIAERAKHDNIDLARIESLWKLVREVLHAVATRYHPKSRRAEMEVPLPHVLHIVELVARDLRQATTQYVPGSHILTLHDLSRLQKWTVLGQRLYFLYRLGRFAFNPGGAVMAEVRDYTTGKMFNTSTDELKGWAVEFCVKKAGYYAIQLYSGNLVLDDVDFLGFTSKRSRRDAEKSDYREERLAEEPLRILVLGQVKAGKSSLINALFGETRAAVDVVPRTRHVEPYILERDGIQRAIILDTAGYEDVTQGRNPFEQLERELLNCDLVIVVSSATMAARAADRLLLDAVREHFIEAPDQVMPPVVVALTHIDRLRPLAEWRPPYNIAQPQGRKEEMIAAALHATAEDLGVEPDQVAPVCLKEERLYNVEEGLVPAILETLDKAGRVKMLRCLRHFHKEEYWRRLWQQAVGAGRLLWKLATTSDAARPADP